MYGIINQNIVLKSLNSSVDNPIPPSDSWSGITGSGPNGKIVCHRLGILKQKGDEFVRSHVRHLEKFLQPGMEALPVIVSACGAVRV